MKLFSNTIQSLEQSLNYSALKQKTISNNIANADTPNFKAKDVSFKSQFESAMQQSEMKANRTDSRHLQFTRSSSSSNLKLMNRTDTAYNHNGNNVDIDKEMSELAENQIYYNALIERINGKFNSLKTVIRGGR